MFLFDKQEVGKRVSQLKEHLGFKSNAFAAEIGCDPGYLTRIEKGINPVSNTYIVIFEKKWNVSREWLLEGKGEMFLVDAEKQKSDTTQVPDQNLLTLLKTEIDVMKASLRRLSALFPPGELEESSDQAWSYQDLTKDKNLSADKLQDISQEKGRKDIS